MYWCILWLLFTKNFCICCFCPFKAMPKLQNTKRAITLKLFFVDYYSMLNTPAWYKLVLFWPTPYYSTYYLGWPPPQKKRNNNIFGEYLHRAIHMAYQAKSWPSLKRKGIKAKFCIIMHQNMEGLSVLMASYNVISSYDHNNLSPPLLW